jgi:hypothetical protein
MPSTREVQKKLRIPEWQVSSFMMDRALDAVVRQIKKLDRNHDIPYLAGTARTETPFTSIVTCPSHSRLGDAALRPIDF